MFTISPPDVRRIPAEPTRNSNLYADSVTDARRAQDEKCACACAKALRRARQGSADRLAADMFAWRHAGDVDPCEDLDDDGCVVLPLYLTHRTAGLGTAPCRHPVHVFLRFVATSGWAVRCGRLHLHESLRAGAMAPPSASHQD